MFRMVVLLLVDRRCVVGSSLSEKAFESWSWDGKEVAQGVPKG
jgi:hypothetical protein